MDSIAASEVLMSFSEGFEVTCWSEKISIYYGGHVIELNLEKFFNENVHVIDVGTRLQLDQIRSIHKELFKLKIENQLDQLNHMILY